MTAPDLLRSGSQRRRRLPKGLLAAAGTVLVLGVGAERWQLSHESGQLLGCVEAAESDAVYADRQIAATVQYAAPGLSGSAPAGVRASLLQVVQQTAAKGVAPAVSARRSCAAVRLLPWHAAQRRGRDAYVVYLGSRTDQLRRVASDLDALSTPSPELASSRADALLALRSALPAHADRLRVLLSP